MAQYYVNRKPLAHGHDVHKGGCVRMPVEQNRRYLGDFADCHAALAEAKKHFERANGCASCSPECRTS